MFANKLALALSSSLRSILTAAAHMSAAAHLSVAALAPSPNCPNLASRQRACALTKGQEKTYCFCSELQRTK